MAYTNKSWSATMSDLRSCFRLWGVREFNAECVLVPAKTVKVQQSLEERTVSLWWHKDGRDFSLSINKWPRAVDNFRALYNVIESIRLNEYRGVEDEVRQVYAQLPAPAAPALARVTPRSVLGVAEDAPLEVAEAAYKVLARRYHPDNRDTGDDARFRQITQALELIRGGA